jgi:hypothetical protein
MMPTDGTRNVPYLLRDKSWQLAGISPETTAAEWAAAQVERVRDDPAGRLALTSRAYHGPFG